MTEGALVRVFTSRVSREEWAELQPLLAAHVVRNAATWRTVFAHWIGAARLASAVDVVVLVGFESRAVLDTAGAGSAAAQARQGLMGDVIARGHADDYELVDQLASSFEPAAASVLRLLEVTVGAPDEARVLERAEHVREALFLSGDLAVAQTLRRDGEDGTTLLFVTLWRDAAALERGLAASLGGDDLLTALRRQQAREWQYELQPISALRLAPDGPAVLVTDDAGVVVDATPAAVSLLGRDVWQVLGARLGDFGRVDDVRGRIDRPEGGALLLHVRSLRDMPAPGRHATLLVPGSGQPPTDDDAAAAVRVAYRWRRPEEVRPSAAVQPG